MFTKHMMRIHVIISRYNHKRSEINNAVWRSQQYQKAFTQNVKYMLELRIRLKICREIRKECEDKMRKLRGRRDMTEIDHPQHAKLT